MVSRTIKILFFSLIVSLHLCAQSKPDRLYVSRVWVADNGDGTYKNPILHADYSDPDAIRVGNDFYLTSSSFEDAPGLPILHSKDLVNWELLAYALPRLQPAGHFNTPRHGEGVWAPALRYHKGEFYLYYPDPDFGIYLIRSKKAAGPWSDPVLVRAGKGLIDPCPLWDDDGKVYLVHAFAGSRAGFKSVLAIQQLDSAGTKTISDDVLVYDGHTSDPTIEGPKLYKRQDYYYIFAPAGGVPTGWQLVLRSKNIFGPYERKVVMDQGTSPVNGPHQGAWVSTQTGEDWFLHFQDKDAYGRILHLQPMSWKDGWPVIGTDADGDGKGTPVMSYKKPDVGKAWPVQTPVESDEFDQSSLGLQWQWMANPQPEWYFTHPATGWLRMNAVTIPDSARNLWEVPNVLLQKFPAEHFTVTMKMSFSFNPKIKGEKAGLTIMGLSYASLAVQSRDCTNVLVYTTCKDAAKGSREKDSVITKITTDTLYFSVEVSPGGRCSFAYSLDGQQFHVVGAPFVAEPGRWIGAKAGMFCTRTMATNDAGWMDVDWFRITP